MPRKIYADSFEEAILKMIDEELNGAEHEAKKNRKIEKQRAMEDLAKTNKQLYDAHIKVGFTPEQAIQLVAAGNMR